MSIWMTLRSGAAAGRLGDGSGASSGVMARPAVSGHHVHGMFRHSPSRRAGQPGPAGRPLPLHTCPDSPRPAGCPIRLRTPARPRIPVIVTQLTHHDLDGYGASTIVGAFTDVARIVHIPRYSDVGPVLEAELKRL